MSDFDGSSDQRKTSVYTLPPEFRELLDIWSFVTCNSSLRTDQHVVIQINSGKYIYIYIYFFFVKYFCQFTVMRRQSYLVILKSFFCWLARTSGEYSRLLLVLSVVQIYPHSGLLVYPDIVSDIRESSNYWTPDLLEPEFAPCIYC